ncbi:hypothetical protein J3456_01855 [Sulfitobacter sp. NFXS29]|uniref:hypothetical protein n=1 Tax=Sulfitobacter sp. NFXS29 TaxID=2818438 RepID=UPI0032E02ED5
MPSNTVISEDQKNFRQGHHLRLERFAEQLFGEKYWKSANTQSILFWKKFYIDVFEVLDSSVFQSIGAVDEHHRNAIQKEISQFSERAKELKLKDEIHSELIASLFRLNFLLLGREPYKARGKQRELSTFRTLTYSQTEEQLSWLLQGHIQRNAQQHGFVDSFEADYAFLEWCVENKRKRGDRSNYVDWVRLKYPDTYFKYK